MSHYAVAVFHLADQDIEDLLALYDENIEVDPYIKFTKEEAIEYARRSYEGLDTATDDECWEKFKEYWGDEEIDEDGNVWSTYNPKSKWDWWSLGGRFRDILEDRCGEENYLSYGCSARVKNIDFSPDKEEYDVACEFWDEYVDNEEVNGGFFAKSYYKDRYGDKETYARRCSLFSTYAVVTPDGEWHSAGNMGFFGVSSETDEEAADWDDHYKERFIDTADPEWILSIVDCHI